MPTLSLKTSKALDARLTTAAQRRRTTKSAVIRDALEVYLRDAKGVAEGSFLDLARDIVGCATGPGDSSYSPKRMRGYGR